MPPPLSDLTNPYASPAADEIADQVEAVAVLPLTREIVFATGLVWIACAGLACAAGYILIAWAGHTYPQLGIEFEFSEQLAHFATGAANAIVMAALVAYAQYHAVMRRDAVWTRTIAMMLMIASLVIALGAVLMFAGSATMLLLFMPSSALAAMLSLMMFRWHAQLSAFRRRQRRSRNPQRKQGPNSQPAA